MLLPGASILASNSLLNVFNNTIKRGRRVCQALF
jgi:hypothetical protein